MKCGQEFMSRISIFPLFLYDYTNLDAIVFILLPTGQSCSKISTYKLNDILYSTHIHKHNNDDRSLVNETTREEVVQAQRNAKT